MPVRRLRGPAINNLMSTIAASDSVSQPVLICKAESAPV
jgi:hypothetical protein